MIGRPTTPVTPKSPEAMMQSPLKGHLGIKSGRKDQFTINKDRHLLLILMNGEKSV